MPDVSELLDLGRDPACEHGNGLDDCPACRLAYSYDGQGCEHGERPPCRRCEIQLANTATLEAEETRLERERARGELIPGWES
jgi:hypothetical protein